MAKQTSFKDRLLNLLGNLSKPVTPIGKTVQNYTPINFWNSPAGRGLVGAQNIARNTGMEGFVNKSYVQPAKTIFDPNASKFSRVLGGLQTGFNVLAPELSLGFNAGFAEIEAIKNAVGAYKNKKPVIPALKAGFEGSQSHDLGSLITKNPYGAGAINVAEFAAPFFLGTSGAKGDLIKAEKEAKSIENLLSKLKFTTKEGEQFNLQGKKITDILKKAETVAPKVEQTIPKVERLLEEVKNIQPRELLPWETVGQKALQQAERVDNALPINLERGTKKIADIVTGKYTDGKVDKKLLDEFANYVNKVHAAPVEGLLKKLEFSDLNSKGLQGIIDFQAGVQEGRFADVAKYFDEKFASNKKAIDKLDYQKNYLPQLWNNTTEEIQKVYGKKLSTNPSFSFSKIVPDYVTGIKAGLTPKFQTVGELVGWYERVSNKTVADIEYFKSLAKQNLIRPSGKAPADWVTLSEDRFPRLTTTFEGHTYNGSYKAPPDLAKLINNYLDPGSELLQKIGNVATRTKNTALSFGLPNPLAGIKGMLQGKSFFDTAGTGLNMHGFNELARHTVAGQGGNFVTRAIEFSADLLNPGRAEKRLSQQIKRAPEAIKNDLTLSIEEHTALLNEVETVATSVGKKWNQLFEAKLFNQIIPSWKLNSYEVLVSRGVDGKQAAKIVNNTYGGINWEAMGRSRDAQNMFRSIILAPDWAESGVRLGGNMAKSLLPQKLLDTSAAQKVKLSSLSSKEAAVYRAASATFVATYVLGNIANKLKSGHYMYENDPGHTFEIEAGYTSDGQKRYLRPYGTAIDFVRVPYDIANALVKGDSSAAGKVIANRLSIPLSAIAHLVFNFDYNGRPLAGKDKFGNEIPLLEGLTNQGAEVIGGLGLPSFARNAANVVTGKQGLEQGLSQGFELPFRYSGGAYSNAQKQAISTLDGASGKEKYDMYQLLKGQDALTENQLNTANLLSPEDKKQMFITRINELKKKSDQKKELQNMKVETTGTTDPTVLNDTVITPKGNTQSITQLLAQQKQSDDRYSMYKAILNRSGDYKYVPKTDSATQSLLQQNGFTPQEMQSMQYKQVAGLDTKSQAQAAYTLLKQGTPFDTLVENKIMTEAVAKEMQRQYGVDADSLIDKIKQTDPYWVQEQLKKSNIEYATKVNKINNEYKLKQMSLILKANRTKTKLPKAKKIKIPKLTTSISSSSKIRSYLSSGRKTKGIRLPKLPSYK